MEGYLPEKTCRTCLQRSDELTSLHSKDDDTGPTLLEKLRFCASMQILVSERTPSNACADCVRCITDYYDFKRRCELSEKTLEDLCGELSEYTFAKVEVVLEQTMSDDTIVVAKKEPDDSNSSCNDGLDWTPCLDVKDEVDEKERGNGVEVGQSESNLKFACETCGKRFKRSYDFNRHLKVHDKPHCCPACGERFKSAEERSTHIQTCRDKDDAAEPKFSCDQCGKEFKQRSKLNRHRQTHTEDRRFRCDVCKTWFKVKYDLQRHTRRHLMLKRRCDGCDKLFGSLSAMLKHRAGTHQHLDPYDDAKDQRMCVVCKKTFLFRADITRHLLSHTEEQWFKCDTCGELFKTNSETLTHERDCHEVPSEDTGSGPSVIPTANTPQERAVPDLVQADSEENLQYLEKKHSSNDEDDQSESKLKFACETCGKRFKRGYDLKRHKQVHERLHYCAVCDKRFESAEERSTHVTCRDKKSTPGELDVPKEDHQCDKCSRSFNKLNSLVQHKRRNHSTKLHRCDKCGESFESAYKLGCHKKRHKRTKCLCDTCGKSFNFPESLRKHIDEHHGAERKVYKCKVCGKQYNFIGSYYTHMKLHRERGQYECGICKKRFEFKVRLYNHVRLHYKQHRCDICGKLFNDSDRLAKHKLCHARDAVKPYGCKLCTKRFSTAAAVSFHMRTLHNAKKHLKCDVCGMEFYNRFHYAAHYSKHTGVKPYQCDICGKGYNYNQDFIPHRKQCAAQKEKGENKEAEVTSTSAS